MIQSFLFVCLSWCILQTTTTSWRGLQSPGVPLTRPSWPSCAHTKWGSSGRIFTQFGRIFGLFCRISRHGKVALIWEIRLVTCFTNLKPVFVMHLVSLHLMCWWKMQMWRKGKKEAMRELKIANGRVEGQNCGKSAKWAAEVVQGLGLGGDWYATPL